MARDVIRFLRNGSIVELPLADPTLTLLDHLRLGERAVGTKEGCNEGDCGACTVAIGRLKDGRVAYEPVCACIQLAGMADGAHVVAIEDLAEGEALHPVQQAMVEHHGSQCGFCTPGIVMSLFTLYQDGRPVDRPVVENWLAGNLCRCTGYRPIIDAALESCGGAPADRFARDASATAATLASLDDGADIFIGDETRFFAAPAHLDSLFALLARHPDATLVAGATDVGLWITKQMRDLPKIVALGRIATLKTIEDTGPAIAIGAGATYHAVEPFIAAIDPDLAILWRRIGSRQVRAAGTVGGNVANGSPIGDTPPVLIALGATLELESAAGIRAMPLEDFFLAYGKQDRRPGEIVRRLVVPKRGDDVFRAYKLSKRFDQDISAVMAAFRFTVAEGRVTAARIAFGGMAATPKRALAAEAAVIGCPVGDLAAAQAVASSLTADFSPLDDMRASAAYRLDAARGLLAKALVEAAAGTTKDTRVRGLREDALEAVA
ncbi:xanthine dehydrogenase small subunit [Segnochrobactrum spirostomi]|uniref:Xanthine dehydrogenase small subunit n=1 Tax=Segnochrobactrum spirostomi TaxID=2608987 RepID=A0A6A7XYH3_9HYPH|nr:xanthine dehydrogenase small subunit [Segnochrobactrum spirostomi]MQT11336.1 xanthine dehydrogenase small subunit [Segnochrobactrum spirostomi]